MLLPQKSRLVSVAIAALLVALPMMAMADDAQLRTISVSGDAELKMAPDKADISISIQEQRPTLAEAKQVTDAQLKALRVVAKKHGIKNEDLQTSSSSTQPVYRWEPNNKRVFEGYTVSHQIRITARAIDKVGMLMDDVLNAKIDQIDNVSYGLENDDAAKEKALTLAVAAAKRKAERVAAAAGESVSQVISIQEGGVNYAPIPMPMMMAKRGMMMAADGAAMAEAAPNPPTGQIVISASATAVFALKD